MGLSKTGISCFDTALVMGHNREPVPPARMMPRMAASLRGVQFVAQAEFGYGGSAHPHRRFAWPRPRLPVRAAAPGGPVGNGPIRILITGGAGFIGSAYTRALLAGDLPGAFVAAVTVLD